MNDLYQKRWTPLLGGFGAVHPEARIGAGVRLGEGVVVEAGCEIGDRAIIGHYTILRPRTIIGADSVLGHLIVCEGETRIGRRTTVQSQTHLTKGMIVEDDVFIAHGVFFSNTRRIRHGRKIDLSLEGPAVRRGARIGVRAVIMPGVIIGEEALIGAGALVTKDARPYGVYYGVPARFIRPVPAEERLRPEAAACAS